MADLFDQRRVKQFDGRFTLLPAKAFHKEKDKLCYKCGAGQACEIERDIDTTELTHQVSLDIRHCQEFMPVLGFTEGMLKGMSGIWNTFRLGKGWFGRVKPGNRIALGNTDKKEIVSIATVTAVAQGSLKEMLEWHAAENHAVMAAQSTKSPHEYLYDDILKRFYGPTIADLTRPATVIYMQVIGDELLSPQEKYAPGDGEERS